MSFSQEVLLKLLISTLVGAAIGAEREYRSKSAGFRTLTMICLGATLFTIFSQLIGSRGAPERIASNVVVGIGFVGAGVIFKGDYRVNGITTAAMIWVTAALGMGMGAGYEWMSVVSCGLILLVLFTFTQLETWIDKANQVRDYKIVCDFNNETLERYEKLFSECGLKFIRNRQLKSADVITGEWVLKGPASKHRVLVNAIINDPTVKAFEF